MRDKAINRIVCVIQRMFFCLKRSEITPANGEKMIYAATRIVSTEAKIAADLSGSISYEINASPSQVNASPTKLTVRAIKSFANVLFLNVRNGAINILRNVFTASFKDCLAN